MHTKIINNIFDIIRKGTDRGIGQLYTEDQFYNSNTITFGNREHVNFGSYSYLGLEHDERLKAGAIEAISKYGIQYGSSRTYMSATLYSELEPLLFRIFQKPAVLTTTTTLAHISAMPVVLEEGDVILMDQQVHSSVQFMIRNMKQYGIPMEIVRHNNMVQLEEKIKRFASEHKRIWYMCDGVYSMYGDTAPIKKLESFLTKYKKFHLYIDDAHGMSWSGKNGAGYVLSQMSFHKKLVLVTSLNKAFAAGGAVVVVENQELSDKIKTCGGPMIFAGQHQTSSLGAAISCAKIHLSEEIKHLQKKLMAKIKLCHALLLEKGLPVVSDGLTPIFFIGVGVPRVGYNLVEKMISSGNYVNLAIFPAVSETCTGVRFTITVNHTREQIENLVNSLNSNFWRALNEENKELSNIHRAFRKVKKFDLNEPFKKRTNVQENTYTIQHETTIKNISSQLWDSLLNNKSSFDHSGLIYQEKIFSENHLNENWKFNYFIVWDNNDLPVFASYFTQCMTKDDALYPSQISFEIEKKRIDEPYYLCSSTLMMGSPLSTGQHFYLKKDKKWKQTLDFFLTYLTNLYEKLEVNTLNLRDIKSNDDDIINYLEDQGMIRVEMPTNYILKNTNNNEINLYLNALRNEQRYYVKKRAIKKEKEFNIRYLNTVDSSVENQLRVLYKNVKNRSYELNLFEWPDAIFNKVLKSDNWDVIGISLKAQPDQLIGMTCSYINGSSYNFIIVGMNYDFIESHDIYNQLLWQVVKRSIQLNCTTVSFGFTTGQNKRKFGAEELYTLSFVQIKDKINTMKISQISVNDVLRNELKRVRNYTKMAVEL